MSDIVERLKALRGYAEQFANWAPSSAKNVADPLKSADGRRFSVTLPNALTIMLAEFADDAGLEITRLRSQVEAMRERCAKVADEFADPSVLNGEGPGSNVASALLHRIDCAERIAAAIRTLPDCALAAAVGER